MIILLVMVFFVLKLTCPWTGFRKEKKFREWVGIRMHKKAKGTKNTRDLKSKEITSVTLMSNDSMEDPLVWVLRTL